MNDVSQDYVSTDAEMSRARSLKTAALILGSSLCLCILMVNHPPGDPHIHTDSSHGQFVNQFVHGWAIVGIVCLYGGLIDVAHRLGASRMRVQLGSLAWGIGTIGLVLAAAISGFASPPTSPEFSDQAVIVMASLRGLNHAFDQVGVAAIGVGTFLWGTVLLQRKLWGSALLSLGVGTFLLIGLVTGHTGATVDGVMLVAFSLLVWSAGITSALLQRKI